MEAVRRGPSLKAGGPHYLKALTGWQRATLDCIWSGPREGAAPSRRVRALPRGSGTRQGRTPWLGSERFGTSTDPSGLRCEENLFRYRAADTDIRWDGVDHDALTRVCAARLLAGGSGVVSSPVTLPAGLAEALDAEGIGLRVETWEACVARAASRAGGRIRLVSVGSGDTHGTASVAVYDAEVTASATLELLPFLKEQAVSLTAHRFGTLQRRAFTV